VLASEVSQACGTPERDSALRMARSLKGAQKKTLGADKGYDTRVLWLTYALTASSPMWLSISRLAGVQSLIAALLAIRAKPNPSTPESGSNKSLAGSSRLPESGS